MARIVDGPSLAAARAGRVCGWLAGSSALVIGAGLAGPALAAPHYVVKPGDWLYHIARVEGVSARQLIALNHIARPYRVYAGETLVVHARRAPAHQARLAKRGLGAPEAVDASFRSEGPGGRYRVRSGDWLLHIAHVEGVTAERLAQANGLSPPYRIYPGQSLVLPLRGPEETAKVTPHDEPNALAEAAATPSSPDPNALQTSSVVLGLYADDTRLGEVDAYIDTDGIVSVDTTEFAKLVRRVLAKAPYERVQGVLARKATVQIVSIDNAGVIATYDSGRQRIQLDIRPEDRLGAFAGAADGARPVAAIGRLLDAGGAPLALAAGEARRQDGGRGSAVPIFTARDGRFAASGLTPGRWRIETASASFDVVVPRADGALVRLGDLRPG
jgi:LysM repeat protein